MTSTCTASLRTSSRAIWNPMANTSPARAHV
uniref:Uncharacterized protein n=1 Tax=Anguilla anguilla TaxID=7936 RepID=A0A0E9RQK9_ANGAN